MVFSSSGVDLDTWITFTPNQISNRAVAFRIINVVHGETDFAIFHILFVFINNLLELRLVICAVSAPICVCKNDERHLWIGHERWRERMMCQVDQAVFCTNSVFIYCSNTKSKECYFQNIFEHYFFIFFLILANIFNFVIYKPQNLGKKSIRIKLLNII